VSDACTGADRDCALHYFCGSAGRQQRLRPRLQVRWASGVSSLRCRHLRCSARTSRQGYQWGQARHQGLCEGLRRMQVSKTSLMSFRT
jgi:hypothetical protein